MAGNIAVADADDDVFQLVAMEIIHVIGQLFRRFRAGGIDHDDGAQRAFGDDAPHQFETFLSGCAIKANFDVGGEHDLTVVYADGGQQFAVRLAITVGDIGGYHFAFRERLDGSGFSCAHASGKYDFKLFHENLSLKQ